MDIRNTRELKQTAFRRLEQAQEGRKILLIYALITVVSSALVTLITYCLDLQIDQYGGLSHMATRTMLSTVSAMLPLVLSLALMCLELGFMAAMLRISRGMYTSVQTLRAGLPRFWAMIRCSLLLMLRYMLAGMAACYLAMAIFTITPLSNGTVELLMPLMEETADLSKGIALDEALVWQLMEAMIPFFVLFAVLYLVLIVPIAYRYRMANYVLLHDPAAGAARAMIESKKMMRGNCIALFKLDLSMWWYYAASFLAAVLCYGDGLLNLLGISLPVSGDAAYFLFYGLFLVATFGINFCLRGKVETAYAMAFDSLRPKEEETSGGVVLGNIFQM